MNWIERTAIQAKELAEIETDPEKSRNLEQLSLINFRMVSEPPATLREACQWIAWFNMASRTYNRDGAGGQLDVILRPYYEQDLKTGLIDDEDAVYYIACLLLNDPHYYQIGGPDREGKDQTNRLSYLILEAAHLLKISCNITIRVFDGMDEKLFSRSMEILAEDRQGYPRFSGDEALVSGFVRNGFSKELARQRIALGCNWMSLPGMEYTLNDVVKINIAKVFEVALEEMLATSLSSTKNLMDIFTHHLYRAVHCTAQGVYFHLNHQYLNEPELLLNLLCYGPIEKGRDASHGGLEFYNMGIDGAGLATVADSFAAIEQRIEVEKCLTWELLKDAVENNFKGEDRGKIRVLLSKSDRYGHGNSLGDKWAKELTVRFTKAIKEEPVPEGVVLIPGWFSWADTLRFGKSVAATPNGRLAGEPISHGANPHPGFRKDGALTALIKAIAQVQPGYGNTAPLQLEITPDIVNMQGGIDVVGKLLKVHFKLGGTLININIVDAEKLRAAHLNPEKYSDLTVRVTGFSAYFTSLSPEFRQLVIDRLIA